MKIRWDPKKQGFPGFHGKYILYSLRGQLRVRSWPRKRGTPKSVKVRRQNLWFKNANRLAKHCAASQQAQAIKMTLGTGLYPRDLLLKCMSAGIIAPITADGREIQYRRPRIDPVSWQGFMLRFSINPVMPVASFNTLSWPLPIRDTAGFWDVAAPTFITIPTGVEVMSFNAAYIMADFPGGQSIVVISGNGLSQPARQDSSVAGQFCVNVSTGPVKVVAGEIYTPQFYRQSGTGELIADFTFFSGTVLEAT